MVGGSSRRCDEFEHVAATKTPRVPGALNLKQLKFQAQVPDVQTQLRARLWPISKRRKPSLRASLGDLEALGNRDYDMTDVPFDGAADGRCRQGLPGKRSRTRLWRTIGSSQAREGDAHGALLARPLDLLEFAQ